MSKTEQKRPQRDSNPLPTTSQPTDLPGSSPPNLNTRTAPNTDPLPNDPTPPQSGAVQSRAGATVSLEVANSAGPPYVVASIEGERQRTSELIRHAATLLNMLLGANSLTDELHLRAALLERMYAKQVGGVEHGCDCEACNYLREIGEVRL